MPGLFESLFKKKPQYDIESMRKDAARYLKDNYIPPEPPKPIVPVSEKPVQYSRRDNHSEEQHMTWDDEPHHAQFQTIDDSFEEKNDPLTGVWLNYLTEAEARALGITLNQRRDKTFSELLVQFIRERGYRDPYVYKRAQIDKRLFSKIVSNPYYRPSKDTVIAFALALNCSLEEADKLLESAGFLLSRSSRRDMLIKWSFVHKLYDLTAVNEILDRFDEKIIGREKVG